MRLTVFPVTRRLDGGPMPKWDDLSKWMKVQIAVMALNNWELLTFNLDIHPELESDWVRGRKDPRAMTRDRVRKALAKLGDPPREFFYVLEATEKTNKQPTKLHLHGAVLLYGEDTIARVRKALLHAGGHGVGNRMAMPRALAVKPFSKERAAYATYLFKFRKRPDPRIAERRLTMADPTTRAAREFWEMITEPW